ncbi:uncharacterized protein Aud_000010 [Aspergillus udagawae]|uniref:Uncharacterized protein n=1 Tax=Aspergillus udagawae TaxID=91492 RepID=A0A8E0QJP8_9EURO|nr:uncharacterized protein Aud_000010 [Aspergillus udagawae]GIC84196.1 hypothetical protein Aud_000010 [Aspergillus udagawae]
MSGCQIDPNPDIIGIGIRISIYILSLASPLISFFLQSAELSGSIESSLGVTGLALFLTTVIQSALGCIALFHALCVLHLLGLVGIAFRPKGHYPATVARTTTFLVLYVVAVSGSLIYFIYVFANAPHFGNKPECNQDTKYVLFGVDIQAINIVIRWIFVAMFAMLELGFVMWLVCLSGAACCMALDCGCGRSNNCDSGLGTDDELYDAGCEHLYDSNAGIDDPEERTAPEHRGLDFWAGSRHDDAHRAANRVCVTVAGQTSPWFRFPASPKNITVPPSLLDEDPPRTCRRAYHSARTTNISKDRPITHLALLPEFCRGRQGKNGIARLKVAYEDEKLSALFRHRLQPGEAYHEGADNAICSTKYDDAGCHERV